MSGVVDESSALDLAEHRIACRSRERVAAEGAAVLPWLEEIGCPAERHESADRNTTGDPLSEDEGIRDDAVLLEGKPRSGAPDTGLDLVEDQERAVLGRQFTGALEVSLRQVENAGLPLDRFDEQRRHPVVHRRLEGLNGGVNVLHPRQQRLEGLAECHLAGE